MSAAPRGRRSEQSAWAPTQELVGRTSLSPAWSAKPRHLSATDLCLGDSTRLYITLRSRRVLLVGFVLLTLVALVYTILGICLTPVFLADEIRALAGNATSSSAFEAHQHAHSPHASTGRSLYVQSADEFALGCSFPLTAVERTCHIAATEASLYLKNASTVPSELARGPAAPPLPKSVRATWKLTSAGGTIAVFTPKGPADTTLASVPCCPIRDTNMERDSYRNYFIESWFDAHQDIRYMQVTTATRRRAHLREALRAWTRFCAEEGVVSWLAYGGLVGWFWNEDMLPWDVDLDFQVTMKTLLALRRFDNHLFDRRYLLEVNGYSSYRLVQDGNNVDARFTDTMSGIYIDIFAVADLGNGDASEAGDRGADRVVRQKMDVDFHTGEIFPLRSTTLMGVFVWRPNNVVRVLKRIYGLGPLVDREYREGDGMWWRWNEQKLMWEKTLMSHFKGYWKEIRT